MLVPRFVSLISRILFNANFDIEQNIVHVFVDLISSQIFHRLLIIKHKPQVYNFEDAFYGYKEANEQAGHLMRCG